LSHFLVSLLSLAPWLPRSRVFGSLGRFFCNVPRTLVRPICFVPHMLMLIACLQSCTLHYRPRLRPSCLHKNVFWYVFLSISAYLAHAALSANDRIRSRAVLYGCLQTLYFGGFWYVACSISPSLSLKLQISLLGFASVLTFSPIPPLRSCFGCSGC
jgi:hypothetical protein